MTHTLRGGMSRDELVRLLAKYKYQSSLESTMTGKTWDMVSDYGRAAFIAEAQDFCPEIVAFVSAWLEQWNHVIVEDGPVLRDTLVDEWREAMGHE